MKFKKKFITLIEVIIAMTLTSLILMAMMFFYRDVIAVGSEIDQLKTEEFHLRYVENRLAYILPRAVSAKDKTGEFAFFSIVDDSFGMPGSQSLIFTFDNGISLDKVFSNNVIGRLLLNQKGELLLFYWPMPKRMSDPTKSLPIKQEILLKGVESLAFEFFVAPSVGKQGTKAPELPVWWYRQLWMQEFNQLPVMVKVVITLSGKSDKLIYIFPLLKSTAHIIL